MLVLGQIFFFSFSISISSCKKVKRMFAAISWISARYDDPPGTGAFFVCCRRTRLGFGTGSFALSHAT